jgi:hypothetical protein
MRYTLRWEEQKGYPMKPRIQKALLADYFELVVKVIWRMENCSMICLCGERFVAETADLILTEV